MAFRTSEILLSKNNVEQTDSGLARCQNNGDTKPSFRKSLYHNNFSMNEFSLHREYLGKSTWWSWQEDPCGHDYRAIFLFSPASIRYVNKSPIKNCWSYTSHLPMDFCCLYFHCFYPPLAPQPPTTSPITIVTPVTPLCRFGEKRFINKPRIVR